MKGKLDDIGRIMHPLRPVLTIDHAVRRQRPLADLPGLAGLDTARVTRADDSDLGKAVVRQRSGVSVVLVHAH